MKYNVYHVSYVYVYVYNVYNEAPSQPHIVIYSMFQFIIIRCIILIRYDQSTKINEIKCNDVKCSKMRYGINL